MAHKEVRAYCPTCGRYISIRLDYEASNFGTVLSHKFNGVWCKGGIGEVAPPPQAKALPEKGP